MATLINRVMFRATAAGSGSFVVSEAITGYMTPAQGDAIDATVYSYAAERDDRSEWEIGTGTYTAATQTLTRTALKSSNANSTVSFSSAPKVMLTGLAADFASAADIANMLETSDIGVSVQAHSTVLDATTASFLTADETKLDGIASGATANSPDATLLARANHTGTQTLSTISDAGTAAAKNTGTSGNAVPLLDAGNAWSENQIFSLNGTFPTFSLRRTGTPAAPSFAAVINYQGPDSVGSNTSYAQMNVVMETNTDGVEDGQYRFTTVRAGTLANRMYIGSGVYHPSATGTDKGSNTINFGAIYDDDSLLTCMALAKEFIAEGVVDLAKWDALVPDQIVPESREEVPVLIDVQVEHFVTERDKDGSLVRRTVLMTEKVQAVELEPVWDEEGNGVDAVEIPITEEIVTPAQTIARQHRTARVFKAMLESGFDPRDPEQYFAKMQSDEALPGMPTQADWVHNDLCLGEQFSRKWLAMEMLAIVCNVMWVKIKDHEARIVALEAPAVKARSQG